MGATGAVYTTIPTAASIEENSAEYATLGQGVLAPSAPLDHDNEAKGNYIPKEADKNDYCYFDGEQILISMDQGDTFQYDPFILNATKLGNALNYTVKLNGNPVASGSKISFNVAGEYTITYTYEDPYNYRLDSDGKLESFTVTYTKTEIVSVALLKKLLNTPSLHLQQILPKQKKFFTITTLIFLQRMLMRMEPLGAKLPLAIRQLCIL